MIVIGRIGFAEFLEVARFAFGVFRTTAEEDFPARIQIRTGLCPCQFLGNPDIGIAGIRQNKKVKGIKLAGFGKTFITGPKTGKDPVGVLVINRNHNNVFGTQRSLAHDRFQAL